MTTQRNHHLCTRCNALLGSFAAGTLDWLSFNALTAEPWACIETLSNERDRLQAKCIKEGHQ